MKSQKFVKMIKDYNQRDWSAWEHNTGHISVEVGEIRDKDNPVYCEGLEKDGVVRSKQYGLFAKENIKHPAIIGEYVGSVRRINDTPNRDDPEKEMERLCEIQLHGHLNKDEKVNIWGDFEDDRMVIDPSKYHNEMIFVNDYRCKVFLSEEEKLMEEEVTSDPTNRVMNCMMVEFLINGWPHVYLVTNRNIYQGQEILTNYGRGYWDKFREIYGRQKKGNISASEKMDTRSSGSEPNSWKIKKAVRRST